ncbi:MAG: hypothetical protein IJD92_04170 [Bacilli bacterium]|nr:hypothetical protein [Bacilli bacterium]
MKLDVNYLNRFSKIEIDNDVLLDKNIYKNTEIRDLKNVHVNGSANIDFEDNIILNLNIKGTMILPCAISLQDVEYNFDTEIEENIGNFEEIYKNNKNSLEISEILWNNIVLEIPIRVVANSVQPSNTSGDGWELISE